ncbi:MAG: hypothetical protein JJT94_03240 [Bernardetiaceae bacterium]|nr:hypothetical protein [Bernardetiaceae bacterium]
MTRIKFRYVHSLLIGLIFTMFLMQACDRNSKPEDYNGVVSKDLLVGKWNLRKIDDHGNMDLILERYAAGEREQMRDRILLGREKAYTRNSFEFKSDNSVSIVGAQDGDAFWRWHAKEPNRLIMEVPNMEEEGITPPKIIVRRLDEEQFIYSTEAKSPSGKVYYITSILEPAD